MQSTRNLPPIQQIRKFYSFITITCDMQTHWARQTKVENIFSRFNNLIHPYFLLHICVVVPHTIYTIERLRLHCPIYAIIQASCRAYKMQPQMEKANARDPGIGHGWELVEVIASKLSIKLPE